MYTENALRYQVLLAYFMNEVYGRNLTIYPIKINFTPPAMLEVIIHFIAKSAEQLLVLIRAWKN